MVNVEDFKLINVDRKLLLDFDVNLFILTSSLNLKKLFVCMSVCVSVNTFGGLSRL